MLGGVFNSGILATGAVPGAHYNYRAAPPDILAKTASESKRSAAPMASVSPMRPCAFRSGTRRSPPSCSGP